MEKLYFSIKEVSELTGLKPYVLRYWETEFEQLRPRKSRNGSRLYRSNDILVVRIIQYLMHVEKYTIEGARSKLNLILDLQKGDQNEENTVDTDIQTLIADRMIAIYSQATQASRKDDIAIIRDSAYLLDTNEGKPVSEKDFLELKRSLRAVLEMLS